MSLDREHATLSSETDCCESASRDDIVVALVSTELQRLVDNLAQRLNRAVAIDDPRIRLLAYSSHQGTRIDPARQQSILMREVPAEVVKWVYEEGGGSATGPFHLPIAPEIGVEVQRLGVPIMHGENRLGFVWILEGEGPLTEEEIEVVEEAAGNAAVVLQRDRLMGELLSSRARELLRDLLVPEDPDLRAHAAALLVDGDLFVSGEPVVAVVATIRTNEKLLSDKERSVIELALDIEGHRLSARRNLTLVRHDHGLLLGSEKDPLMRGEGVVSVGTSLVERVERELPNSDPLVGIGSVVPDLADAHNSYREARDAAEVQRVVGLGKVQRFEELGIYGLLAHIPPELRSPELLPEGVVRLLEQGNRGESFASTLEVYFDHACDARATADSLHVHRATLYYRLEQIQELSGIDLHSGSDRLTMHLGLKLARLLGLLHD